MILKAGVSKIDIGVSKIDIGVNKIDIGVNKIYILLVEVKLWIKRFLMFLENGTKKCTMQGGGGSYLDK